MSEDRGVLKSLWIFIPNDGDKIQEALLHLDEPLDRWFVKPTPIGIFDFIKKIENLASHS